MCLSFIMSRLHVYKKVIVLSSVVIRLWFLWKFITIDHTNPSGPVGLRGMLLPSEQVSDLSSGEDAPLPVLVSQEPFPRPMPSQLNAGPAVRPPLITEYICHLGTGHTSQNQWVTCLPTELTPSSVQGHFLQPTLFQLITGLLLSPDPKPSGLPTLRKKHNLTEQGQATPIRWTAPLPQRPS